MEQKFESLHIDIEKKIFELNGKKMDRVTSLELNWTPEEGWLLNIAFETLYSRASESRNKL